MAWNDAAPGRRAPEPVAVIGLACRFPGAESPDDFWRLVERGESTISGVPASRWNWERSAGAFPPGIPARALTHGSFIADLEAFDADFFGLSDGEAQRLDPQQRLALETTWEALEAACIRPGDLAGSFTGVIIGVGHTDHATRLLNDHAGCDGKIGLHAYECLVANRVSHAFNLKGPSYAVNAACASSAHAIHAACQSLRAGECDVVVSGGVNVKLAPCETVSSVMAKWASPDGECRSFGADGAGFVAGEGCGIVVLKRLEDALRDGDPVWGVIRDSVLGHNGTSSTLSWPSGNAQRDLLRRLLARNGLQPGDVDAIEAHGTGGAMSDRIEASAFTDVLGCDRRDAAPLRVGCLKAHMGHLEAASGVAGLIKMILGMQHDTLPRIPGLRALNPAIRPHPGVRFLTANEAWPRAGRTRRAVIANYSFGGANGVLLLEDAPAGSGPFDRRAEAAPAAAGDVRLLALRARSAGGLVALHERLLGHLEDRDRELDDDELHTLNVHRGALRQRAVWLARGAGALSDALRRPAFAGNATLPPAWRDADRVLALPAGTFGLDAPHAFARLVAGPIGARLWRAWQAEVGPAALATAPGAQRRALAAFWLRTFDRLGVHPRAVLVDPELAPAVGLVLPELRVDALAHWIADGTAAGAAPAGAPPCIAWPGAAAMPAWTWSAARASLVFGALPTAALGRGDAPALGADDGAFEDGADADLALAQLFARLYAAGCDVRWEHLSAGAKRPLAAAPFDRKLLWFTPRSSLADRPILAAQPS